MNSLKILNEDVVENCISPDMPAKEYIITDFLRTWLSFCNLKYQFAFVQWRTEFCKEEDFNDKDLEKAKDILRERQQSDLEEVWETKEKMIDIFSELRKSKWKPKPPPQSASPDKKKKAKKPDIMSDFKLSQNNKINHFHEIGFNDPVVMEVAKSKKKDGTSSHDNLPQNAPMLPLPDHIEEINITKVTRRGLVYNKSCYNSETSPFMVYAPSHYIVRKVYLVMASISKSLTDKDKKTYRERYLDALYEAFGVSSHL